ncbi:unnamed protein product, partial [Allacma fusca]
EEIISELEMFGAFSGDGGALGVIVSGPTAVTGFAFVEIESFRRGKNGRASGLEPESMVMILGRER